MLRVLKKAQDEVSGENIAKELGISRSAVWKQVQKLREAGYDIEARPSHGYKLVSTPDRLTKEELELNLPPEFLDQVLFFDKVDSTNDLAKQMAGTGKFDPLGLVAAEEQVGGRGRFGRAWSSPRGGVWISLVVRPKISARSASRVALLAAVAVSRARRPLPTRSHIAHTRPAFRADDWTDYHLAGGEVHCATNILRTPREDLFWWELQ